MKIARSFLESKGMRAVFQKKGKKRAKKLLKRGEKGKICESLGKNVQKRVGDCVRLLHAIKC